MSSDQRPNTSPNLPSNFLAGDVIFFAGKGDLSGVFGKWLVRSFGEQPTYAVHVAQCLDAERVLEMDGRVKIKNLCQLFNSKRGFQVWRCTWLNDTQREALNRKALAYLNAKFGLAKLFTHLLDCLLTKLVRKDIFLFRRLNHNDRYPICSWVTAFSYDRVLHYQFGIEPNGADPDQMHDWVTAHPNDWQCTYTLSWNAQTETATDIQIPLEKRGIS